MSKPLTLRNREDKGDVDPGLRINSRRTLQNLSPSYFSDFSTFLLFLMLPMRAAFTKRRRDREHEIPTAAAIMAIV